MNNLKNVRKKTKLTLREVAEHMNTTIRTVLRWENVERDVNSDILQRLAAYFNCTVDELLNGAASNEIEVRIVIKESLNEMEAIDLSKDAPYLETVVLTPDKSMASIVFGKDKTLREALDAILAEEDRIEAARRALYA